MYTIEKITRKNGRKYQAIATLNEIEDVINYMQQTFQYTPKFYELGIITKESVKVFNYCIKDRTNTIIATANGYSKKDAENNVSKEALKYYGQQIEN